MEDYDVDAQELVEAETSQEEPLEEVPKNPPKQKKTAADFFRPIQISSDVNRTTVGVDTDHITPSLLIAASKKILAVSRGESKGDDRDSLEYQRVYGSSEYLPEHIQRDGGKVARNLLWKATNRGNIDFIGTGALEPHVDSVFNDSKLAQYIDGTNMFEALDANTKVTRIGEGGVGDQRMAPKEMRNIHNSFMGFIDPLRFPECLTPNHQVLTSTGWVDIDKVTTDTKVSCFYGGKLCFRKPSRVLSYDYNDDLYTYYSPSICFEVTKNHRMYVSDDGTSWDFVEVSSLGGNKYFLDMDGNKHLVDCSDIRSVPADTKVYCLTIVGGRFITRLNKRVGYWTGNSLRIGLDSYMSKNTKKGSDGKLYTRMTNAKTGKEEWVDSVTLARSKVATAEYAPGGKYGDDKYVPIPRSSTGIVSYVPRKEIEYFSMRPDEMFSLAANTAPYVSGIKEMRAMLACLHPDTPLMVRRNDLVVNVQAGTYEFHEGDMMVSLVDGKPGWRPVAGMQIIGTKERLYAVYMASGESVFVTSTHKWPVKHGNKLRKVETKKLIPGMKIPCMNTFRIGDDGVLGKFKLDTIVDVSISHEAPGYVVNIDMDDHCYLLGNGLLTHNSKHFASVVPLDKPEVPWISTIDPDTGGPIEAKIGSMMGARKAEGNGRVKAVRKDRIEVEYDDGSTKRYELYNNFPNNQKGYIDSTPLVKAGDRVSKGTMLARTNFTDDRGEAAHGTNLRTVFLSWNGMNYEDAKVISESAAKKLSSTTMYKSGIDIDKTVKLGKANYLGWKPAEYSKEQMDNIGSDGIVKVGTVVHKGDPLFVGMRILPPSPGSFGKRQFEDVSSTWEHAHPGVVTDVAQTRKGLKVFVKMSAPAQIGDKLSNSVGTKGVVAKVLPDDQMPCDEKGVPYDVIESPLSIISRCYDDKTEFLTEHGWKLGKDVRSFDKLMCYNPHNNTIDWGYQLFPMHKRHYIGTMYGYNDKDTDFLVSEGHKVWGKKKGWFRNFFEGTVEDFYNRSAFIPRLPFRANCGYKDFLCIDGKRINHVDAFARLLGLYMGLNGKIIIKNTHKYVSFGTFGKPIDPLSYTGILCSAALCGYHVDHRSKLPYCRIENKELRNHIQSFYRNGYFTVPDWLYDQTAPAIEGFISGLMISHPDDCFETPSKDVADSIQHLACCIGYPTSIIKLSEDRYKVKFDFSGNSYAELIKRNWYTKEYDGMIYCPTVNTGYVLTRRNGKLICMGNTNSAILPILQLSEVAKKRGKPYYVENFPQKDINEFAVEESKKYNVPLTHTVTDPSTGRKIRDVQAGTLFCYKQKHLSESKESARGTGGYTADDIPGRGGYSGCLHGDTLIYTDKGKMPIRDIVLNKREVSVLSWDRTKRKFAYHRVTDWFEHAVPSSNLLTVTLEDPAFRITATANHNMYDNFGEKFLLGDMDPGERLAVYRIQVGRKHPIPSYRITSMAPYVTDDAVTRVYDITVETTHNYVANGFLVSNSKRIGGMETAALVSHGSWNVLKDSKLVRGQSNQDFWRSIRTGEVPAMPTEPLVYQKFYNHLKAAGVNVKRTPTGVSIMSMTDKAAKELTGSRELNSADTFDSTTYAPLKGGLFGPDLFGEDGNQWAYIQLDEPLPNPVMEEPIRRILNITKKQFDDIIEGKEQLDGKTGGQAIKDALSSINVHKALEDAKQEYLHSSKSKKDQALKRYVDLYRMDKNGTSPADFMMTRIPVLPAKFRPVMSSGGLTMVSDANYLYKQMLEARDDLRNVKDLPEAVQGEARSNIYRAWHELTGMTDPVSPKLKQKNVKGLLEWALGPSPKTSAFQSKLLSSTVDVVGRGVAVPDPELKLDEIGIPEDAAFDLYGPFITRKLVNMNYTPLEAMKQVKGHTPAAKEALEEVMKNRPVIFNRAPTLHKMSMLGFNPKLVAGHAYRVNPSMVGPAALDFDGNCLDFDSKIFAKISKSTLDKVDVVEYSSANLIKKEVDMKFDGKSEVRATNENGEVVVVRIGEFPHSQEPVTKDKNGADIYAVPEGISVLSVDPKTGDSCYKKVTGFTHEKGCEVAEITVLGRSVIASTNESLAVFDYKNGGLEKVSPLDEETKSKHIPVLKKDPRPFGTFGDADLGWWMGAFLSDGWVCDNYVGYTKNEDVKREKFIKVSRKIHENFNAKTYEGKANDGKLANSVKIHLFGHEFAEIVRRFGMYTEDKAEGRSCLSKIIPDWVLYHASEDMLYGLLSGLLDGDGSIAKNTTQALPRFNCRLCTSSAYLRDSFKNLLFRLGIRYSTTVVPPRGWSKEAYIVCPSTVDMFDVLGRLNCIGDRESSLIEEWKNTPPRTDRGDVVPMTDSEWEGIRALIPVKEDCMFSKTKNPRSITRAKLLQYVDRFKDVLPELAARVTNTDTLWAVPSEIVKLEGTRDVFDLIVEDTKVFSANNGIIVYDTANVHVPVTDAAVRDVRQKMMPQDNLLTMRKGTPQFPVEKEYRQGVYLASRMKGDKPVKVFDTRAEAIRAYNNNEIDIDTPIEIRHNR